jgi:hypothetical protein
MQIISLCANYGFQGIQKSQIAGSVDNLLTPGPSALGVMHNESRLLPIPRPNLLPKLSQPKVSPAMLSLPAKSKLDSLMLPIPASLPHRGSLAMAQQKAAEKYVSFFLALGENVDMLPLLNPILRTSYPDTDSTAVLKGRARENATAELLMSLFVSAADRFATIGKKIVVILEDVQCETPRSLFAFFIFIYFFFLTDEPLLTTLEIIERFAFLQGWTLRAGQCS